jgi:hypothetical protein
VNKNTEFAKNLIDIGTRKIIGVLGSGDSFQIVEAFIENGGKFIESPTEFSSPIIASAINKCTLNNNYAASISIRGPGLVSSLPGLYHNYVEDLKSISISEDLAQNEADYNFHKIFDSESALLSVGLSKTNSIFESTISKDLSNFISTSTDKMLHLTTGSKNIYKYSSSPNELCNNLFDFNNYKNKIFVIGKRGIEILSKYKSILSEVKFFLTPAALPFNDLNSKNFLGVWTGKEQFKPYFEEFKLLNNSCIIRIGVMKRELLTLKVAIPHYDIPLSSISDVNTIYELIESSTTNGVEDVKNYLDKFRLNLANCADSWSVYSVVSFINEIGIDFNYCFDVGSYATVIENYIRPLKIRRLHSSFNGKFMGTGLPISIGVGLAEPNIPILCFLGEGSLSASVNEVTLVASLQLPICIIVFSNGGMHSIVGNKNIITQRQNIFVPANYAALEGIELQNLPAHKCNSISQFSSIISGWDKKSPIILFLEFESNNYVKGVELLR